MQSKPVSILACARDETQSVGSSTGVMRFMSTILSNSSLIKGLSANGHFREGWGRWGVSRAVHFSGLDLVSAREFPDAVKKVREFRHKISNTSDGWPASCFNVTVHFYNAMLFSGLQAKDCWSCSFSNASNCAESALGVFPSDWHANDAVAGNFSSVSLTDDGSSHIGWPFADIWSG